MALNYTKYFLKIFVPLLDRIKDRADIRFLYRHTACITVTKGKTLFPSKSPAANGNIIIVADGLVNGYIIDEEMGNTDIWLGTVGSVFIKDNLSPDIVFNLYAIEDAMIFLIDRDELEQGCNRYPSISSILNSYIYASAVKDVDFRNILFRMQNLENRISLFKRIYPGIFERMPIDLLLSYLGFDLCLMPELFPDNRWHSRYFT